MTHKCQTCGTALGRYNDSRLCFACQVKGRDAERNPVVISSRQLQHGPQKPVVIEIAAIGRMNPRRQTAAIRNPHFNFNISAASSRI
jgi:hypothetical protein